MPVAAAIGAAGSMLVSGLNNAFAQRNADVSFQRQKELMALQQQYAVENWNRENNYNKPEEQMKRLKAAGLNPDLVYGNGAAGLQAGPTAAPTAPSAPMAQTIPMANPIVEGAQAALAINQSDKAGSEAVKNRIENTYLAEQIEIGLREALSRINVNEKTKAKLEAEIPNISKQGALIDKQVSEIAEKITASQWHRVCEYIQTCVDAKLKGAQADQITKLTPALLRLNNSQAALNEAYEKIAGLYGDPDKASELLHAWLDTIGEELANGVDWLLEKVGLKEPDPSAHDKWAKENGSGHSKPPMQWKPRW